MSYFSLFFLSSFSKEIRPLPLILKHKSTYVRTHTPYSSICLLCFLLSTNYIPCLCIITSCLLSVHFFSTPLLRHYQIERILTFLHLSSAVFFPRSSFSFWKITKPAEQCCIINDILEKLFLYCLKKNLIISQIIKNHKHWEMLNI